METTKYYAGIDLHRDYSYITIMDQSGYIQKQGTYKNREDELIPTLLKYQGIQAVVESTYGWYWLGEKLEAARINYHLAHPQKVKAIAGTKKTDKVDSKILADLLRVNLLPMAYIPTSDERALKQLLRFRFGLVTQKSTAKRRLRDLLAKQNLHCPARDISGKGAREWLEAQCFKFPYEMEINTLLTQISQLEEHIQKYNQQIQQQVGANGNAQLLMSIPGVGPIIALTLTMEIGRIGRFSNARALSSYAGIVPRVAASGGKTYMGGMTKYGNPYLRWALAEAVPHVIRKDITYKQFYEKLKAKKAKAKAKVAVMNKLLRAIYMMLTKQVPFMIQVPVSE
jgi:transposase